MVVDMVKSTLHTIYSGFYIKRIFFYNNVEGLPANLRRYTMKKKSWKVKDFLV